jgi:hypothetical protein
MNQIDYYSTSIYTMKNHIQLEKAYIENKQYAFCEDQVWRTGLNEFEKSKKKCKEMLIFFSVAEENSGILYVGKLINIFLDEENKQTRYYFQMLFKLENPKPLSTLILLKTNKSLSNDYIRPYAVVKLPREIFLWKEEVGLESVLEERKLGEEQFSYKKENLSKSLLNFWQWSFSDLLSNTLRGAMAEYIVAMALDIDNKIQVNWKAYDLDYAGLKIEVKSSSYIQSWYQKKYSKIIFNIPLTHEFDIKTGKQSDVSQRQADIYIFCVLIHKIQDTINPLNLEQWRFYIVDTKDLNKEMGKSKTISLTKFRKINHISCNFDKLKNKIDYLKNKYNYHQSSSRS